jgi:Serine aminopeptidase, S33
METVAWFMLWGMAPVVTSFVQESFQKKKKKTTTTTTIPVDSFISTATEKELAALQEPPSSVTIPLRNVHGELVALEAPITDENIQCMEKWLPGCEHGWFQSCYRSAKLHYRKWLPSPPSQSPKAIVIFMHGISTHCGKAIVLNGRKMCMALLSDTLLDQTVALYAFDLYGHGLSEGTRYWIPESWTTNRDDYIAFCKLVSTFHPNVPFLYVKRIVFLQTFLILYSFDLSALTPRENPNFGTVSLGKVTVVHCRCWWLATFKTTHHCQEGLILSFSWLLPLLVTFRPPQFTSCWSF